MKHLKTSKKLLILLIFTAFSAYFSACSESTVEENQTDDEFIKEVVTAGIGSNQQEDDDLMSNEAYDLDNGGAVGNNGGGDTPIDSLVKWGRRITGTSVTVTITSEGDSIKNATIERTINGVFHIIGYVNGNLDSIQKPYTEVLRRKAVFKRIAHTPRPRFNWKLYKVSMVDGGTTVPQNSNDYVQMQQIQVYVNNVLQYTFQGPDFTQNVFTTRRFNGSGIPEVRIGDQVKIVVSTYSAQSEQDIVAWHWARNTFGFHREPFVMTSQVPSGSGWNRVYEKTFTIYPQHKIGKFNGYISASTYKSLYDDSPVEFASDLAGAPYRVLP
ncbi:MAG: hypothetical protein L0Y79_00130 [Chlorobi bacterium]|nr:hypothetical protein [Chlorobiota bacterium]MCI0716513.1 hypothetical protein [Chlorobiota bacterium]